ncbi:MAG: MBL fold metallo-hydrolase [Deltaproteobacteria bacterium]
MSSAPFKIHRVTGYIENIFLVEYPNGLLLLDSGCYNDVPLIEHYCLHELKRPLQDIRLIAVSHMHPDHCGGAVVLRRKYGIPIAAHRQVDRWYAGFGGALQQMLDRYMALIVARHNHRKWQYLGYKRILHPDHFLEDGDPLPGFSDWQAFHVPGHTLHDLIFFHHQSGFLYIADMICEVHGDNRLPLPVLFPELMAASYDKAAALNASTLLLAHGEVKNPADSPALFGYMKERLAWPANQMTRRVHRMSVYSPEVRQKLRRHRQ